MKYQNGFTILELMMTIVVAAILIAVAVPGYFNLVQNNQIIATTNKLSASLNLARLEAIRRGDDVSICAASSAALNACGTAAQWGLGWIVFVDRNNNNNVDVNDIIVRVNEQLPQNITVTTTSNLVTYDGTGFLSGNGLNFTIQATGCTGNSGRQLAIAQSGRLSLTSFACP